MPRVPVQVGYGRPSEWVAVGVGVAGGGFTLPEAEFELVSQNCCDCIRHKQEGGVFQVDRTCEQKP